MAEGKLSAAGRAHMNDFGDNLDPTKSFQGLILALQQYWAAWGCVILQPYDMEVGAGTFHPATTLRALGPKPWNAAYVQPKAPGTPCPVQSATAQIVLLSFSQTQ